MNNKTKQLTRPIFLIAAAMTVFLAESGEGGVGESAVITLAFPPGARATGTGEAFTGVSDDATATYYNPAGLGLSPLGHSWKLHLVDKGHHFTALAAKKKKDFGARSAIWAGTAKGLLRYNGKLWQHYDYHLIESNDRLETIAEKYFEIEDKDLLNQAIWTIRSENGIGMKRFAAIKMKLRGALSRLDSLSADSSAEVLARRIVEVPAEERSSTKIYALIASSIDSTNASKMSEEFVRIFEQDDKDLEDFTELRIPFSIAVRDSVTALALDRSDKLWVGTTKGLWSYSDNRWTRYTTLEGLPSNVITAVNAGPYSEIVVGTDRGVALFTDGEWKVKGDSTSLPSVEITSVSFGPNDIVYAGTRAGLVKIEHDSVTVFDTSDGLLSREVRSLFLDSGNRLWIGGPDGITIFQSPTWKRYKFPNSNVTSFAEQNERTVWIGTDKGAISYTSGKTVTDQRGNTTEQQPEWKVFHSKNALTGEKVTTLIVYDKDVWLATERAINQYDIAERQASFAFEMLLPTFKLTELWHLYGAFVWPTQDWGTLGFSLNYINMGRNEIYDALGRMDREVRSWEGVFGLSYGLPINENLSLGLGAKYVVSALAPGLGENGEGVGQTFAIDASVMKRDLFIKNLDVGFMFQNMGPHIFYIDRNQRDPIPFTLRLGLMYKAIETPIHDLRLVCDLHKEVVKNHYDGEPDPFYKALWTDLLNDEEEDFVYELQEINYNMGLEWWYAQIFALRTGFLFDYIGVRYEWTFGFGIRYGTLNFDWSYIYSPEGFMKGVLKQFEYGKDGATGARDGQWRASFIVMF